MLTNKNKIQTVLIATSYDSMVIYTISKVLNDNNKHIKYLIHIINFYDNDSSLYDDSLVTKKELYGWINESIFKQTGIEINRILESEFSKTILQRFKENSADYITIYE